jgi:hypothetical protein
MDRESSRLSIAAIGHSVTSMRIAFTRRLKVSRVSSAVAALAVTAISASAVHASRLAVLEARDLEATSTASAVK